MPADPTPKETWYDNGLRFTCTQCGNCCTGPPGFVWFNDDERDAMAEYLNLPVDEFLKRYARQHHGKWTLGELKTNHGYDCILLDRTPDGRAMCSVYPVRPVQCRTWPFWPENLASAEHYVRAARTCPGMQKGMAGEGKLYPIEKIRILRDRTDD